MTQSAPWHDSWQRVDDTTDPGAEQRSRESGLFVAFTGFRVVGRKA